MVMRSSMDGFLHLACRSRDFVTNAALTKAGLIDKIRA